MAAPKYRGAHAALRRRLAPMVAAGRALCVRCGRPILPGWRWELDHTDDGRGWLGPAHASCNHQAGGRKGARLAAERKRPRSRMDPNAEVCLGVEIALDRSHTSVVAACEQGDTTLVELVRYAAGADTADVIAEVARDLYVVGVALNSISASMTLARPLRDHKLEPTLLTGADVAVAHGAFLDLHRAERLRLVEHGALVDALKAADQRVRGERYVVDRRGTLVDLSPLLAAELAVWCLQNLPAPLPEPNIF